MDFPLQILHPAKAKSPTSTTRSYPHHNGLARSLMVTSNSDLFTHYKTTPLSFHAEHSQVFHEVPHTTNDDATYLRHSPVFPHLLFPSKVELLFRFYRLFPRLARQVFLFSFFDIALQYPPNSYTAHMVYLVY